MPALPWTRSLRWRLLVATLVALVLALVLAGWLLASLFRDHVLRQFATTLTAQLDQVTARLDFGPDGRPVLDAASLTDPRWSRPYSGLYWQLDGTGGATQRGALRSRSLWDTALVVAGDVLDADAVHVHEVAGPNGARLLVVERVVRPQDGATAAAPWRLLVASDLRETEVAVDRFNGVLLASLAALLVLLCAAAVAQVAVGLAPLRTLQRALLAVREGRSARLEGQFPVEVQALTDDFNGVLDRNAEVVARARTQAGNLAQAIKTPLAAMAQAAAMAQQRPQEAVELARLVQEQVASARRQVDWHLARVMEHVHAGRDLQLVCVPMPRPLFFAGEVQDLQEMLGNVLDNACKWAQRKVHVSVVSGAHAPRPMVSILVDDDGPGIDADRRDGVITRGARLDESVPGSGLGLAIVQELVSLYGGSLALGTSPLGGLRVELALPAA